MELALNLRSAAAVAALAVAVVAAPSNAASLIGDSITATYYFPDKSNVYGNYSVSPSDTFTVGAGTEATGVVDGAAFTDFDFAATSLTMNLTSSASYNTASFNGWKFINNSKNFDRVTSVFGLQESYVAVVRNTLSVNWQGLNWSAGDKIVINFATVPEPATWAMMVGGFGVVGFGMRRRRMQTVAA